MSAYITRESKESAIRTIEGCVQAINETPEIPYKIGTLTCEHITKYLNEYKSILEKEVRDAGHTTNARRREHC